MDDTRFDDLTRRLHITPTRRLTIGGALSALAGMSLAAAIPDTVAKKKKRKKKRKKKKGPKEFADAACPPVSDLGFTGNSRFAQTFIAQRNGKLTRAEFQLLSNQDDMSFVVEIREVNGAEAPDTVIATTTVANIPLTGSSDPPRVVSVTFTNAATVVSELRYAISVTRIGNGVFSVLGNTAPANVCGDGHLYSDQQADGDFVPSPNSDMVFAAFVSA